MSSIQPIKVWGKGGPNPPKVPMILEELNIPFEIVPDFGFPQVKSPEYLEINPNGRMPAIQDPNTGITLWESGAILEYLTEQYDKDHKISFEYGTPEYYQAKQWMYFQVTGQGPYYGQATWFTKFHPEQLPSAIERYGKEVARVTGVLELHLSKQQAGADGPWLVGGKMSYADLAFTMWQQVAEGVVKKDLYDPAAFPNVQKWMGNMKKRETVQRALGMLMQH